MTDPADPPRPHVHAADEMPRRVRLAVALLALLVGLTTGTLLWFYLGPFHDAQRERHRLACQVQELGGERVGDVHCPPASASPSPHPRKHRSGGPAPVLTPAPGSTVVIVPPEGPASNPRPTSTGSAPAPRRTSKPRPHHTPTGEPSPTPVACATAGPIHACLDKPLPLEEP